MADPQRLLIARLAFDIVAGAGLAIGTAWGGLLTNFAAGAFLVILRPYRVGEKSPA